MWPHQANKSSPIKMIAYLIVTSLMCCASAVPEFSKMSFGSKGNY